MNFARKKAHYMHDDADHTASSYVEHFAFGIHFARNKTRACMVMWMTLTC
jgi:hypothetical protein